MKTLKFLKMTLFMVLIVTFSSCSKDEDKASIVGTWKYSSEVPFIATHVTYNENGKFELFSTDDDDYSEYGEYKVENDILMEKYSDEDEWYKSKIVELTETTLTLQEIDDDGTPSEDIYTLTKESK